MTNGHPGQAHALLPHQEAQATIASFSNSASQLLPLNLASWMFLPSVSYTGAWSQHLSGNLPFLLFEDYTWGQIW